MNNETTKPASKKRFPIGELVGVLFVIGFATWFLLWPAFQNARDSFGVASWPTATGEVTASSETKRNKSDGATSTSYRFRYEYHVDKSKYSGWRYSLGAPSGGQRSGVKRFQEGDTIEVHYNPSHPERSVINVEVKSWWNFVVLGVASLLAVTALFVIFKRNPHR